MNELMISTNLPPNGKDSKSDIADGCAYPASRPLVLCGPSGCGKSTILKAVMSHPQYKDRLGFSVSHTTRKPRPGEQHGREYYFTDRHCMLRDIEAGLFIESAEFSGNLYGTSKESVKRCQNDGKICVLDIDAQGVRLLKKVPNLDPLYVFIKPPNVETLENRLRGRNTETEESIRRRLHIAEVEMSFGEEPGVFDEVIVNDSLDVAVERLKAVVDRCDNGGGPDVSNGVDPVVKEEIGHGVAEKNGSGDVVVKNGFVSPEKGVAFSFGINGHVPAKKAKPSTESSRDSTPGVER